MSAVNWQNRRRGQSLVAHHIAGLKSSSKITYFEIMFELTDCW